MKNLIFLFFAISIIALSCEKNKLPVIKSFTASEGTYIGLVHLVAEPVDGAEIYQFERKNPETLQWESISWTERNLSEDIGEDLPNDIIIPGKAYEYRVRTWSDDKSYSDYSEVETGYSYATLPIQFSEINITTNTNDNDYDDILFVWKDSLPSDIMNYSSRHFTIKYATEDNLAYPSVLIDNITSNSLTDRFFSSTKYLKKSRPVYYYKIDALYYYNKFNQEGNTVVLSYSNEGALVKEDDIPGGGGGGGIGTVSYTVNNLGEINLASTGAKYNLSMRVDGTTPYLGYIDNYSSSTGLPVIMSNTGSGWNSVTSMPDNIVNDNDFNEFGFEVAGGVIYLGALNSESLYIYKYESEAWSDNLTDDSFGTVSLPHNIDIAVLNNELYAIFDYQPDDLLKVMKYNGSSWQQVGSDIISFSDKYEPQLKNIDGNLYLWYNEGTGSTAGINIKHWTGSAWTDDFQWTHEYSGGFDVIKAGNDLYFLSEGFSGSYFGGVYKITSSTTADNLVKDETWFFDIYGLSADGDNNIVIAAMKWESIDVSYPTLYVYDGTSWSEMDDDNSEGLNKDYSTSVISEGNDLHFIYGLGSSINTFNFPTILKAKKYSK